MNRFFFSILIVFLFSSCADKYLSYKSNYTFKSPDSKPDYNQFDYWAAHPWKWDPSDSIPKPLRNQERDSLVDVFFLHPTTLTSKKQKEISNAAIDDNYINGKTDYSTIFFQASVFNQQCRVFAPRYRQAHINNFYSTDKEKAALAFELAYQDLKTAFEYYLQHWNSGRPIIIAGHSQGSFLGERLLKEFFDGKQLQNKLVTAYIIGWPLPENYFSSIKICADSLQTGCACSWRTFRNGYVPPYLKNEKETVLVTNPLSWTTSNSYVPKQINKGSVLTNFNKVYKHVTDAQISKGLLYVKKPKFPGGFLYRSKNYHIADINLFYVNIQEDIKRRIGLFWKG